MNTWCELLDEFGIDYILVGPNPNVGKNYTCRMSEQIQDADLKLWKNTIKNINAQQHKIILLNENEYLSDKLKEILE